jgi:cytidine deaminase
MEYRPLTPQDQELIDAATAVIRENYVSGRHHVGAALRGASGRVYVGVHLDSPGIDICAEAVAVGTAAASGERELDSIVAVKLVEGVEPRVLSPCGICRELLKFHSPEMSVIFVDNGDMKKCRASDLLPGPYIRP